MIVIVSISVKKMFTGAVSVEQRLLKLMVMNLSCYAIYASRRLYSCVAVTFCNCAHAILQQCTLSDNHRQGVVTANSHVTAMSLLHHRLGVAGGLLLPHLSPYTRSTSWSDRAEAGLRRLSNPNPEHAGKTNNT